MIQTMKLQNFKTMTIRFKVVLELARKSVEQLLNFSNNVLDKVTGNSFFATPHPLLADVSTAIADLTTAAAAAVGGSQVQVTERNVKRLTLENLLTELGHYVEDIANEPGNAVPEDLPVQIIESAGMKVKRVAIKQKQIFAVVAGRLTGTVAATAEAVRHGFHEWQYTTTPDDESSWIDLTSTTKAKTIVEDLTSGSRVYVRHRAVLKTGPEDWTSPINVIVP